MDIRVGETVAGHRLIEKIGEGHYGEVWRAEYMGQPVALKLFNARRKTAQLKRETFAQYALGRLPGEEGKYFPRIEQIDLDADQPFMRMEFIEGRPLEDVLANPVMNLETRLALGTKILQALEVVHKHDFVHGDLSPLNVLVTPTAEIKLIDVGYGKLFDESVDPVLSTSQEDAPTLGVASPFYAAPERFKAEFLEGCGKPADIFSFGKVLYRLITGESPFVIKPVSMKFKALGAKWDDYLFKCLEEDPANRFADATAALSVYRELNRPRSAGGEYRAGCPECGRTMAIPGGWAGERFNCEPCGAALEVLFYDEANRMASTALVSGDDAGIQFITDAAVVEERARKFCPACGGSILVEAKKCRHCGVWVDEAARRVTETRIRRRGVAPIVHEQSFAVQAVVTFFAYFVFWLPGAILNAFFLGEAKRHQKQTGVEPSGLMPLQLMMWVLVYLPLLGLAAIFVLGIAGALLSTAVR